MADETGEAVASPSDGHETLVVKASDEPPSLRRGRRVSPKLMIVSAAVLVTAIALIAMSVVAVHHRDDANTDQQRIAMSDAAGDWVQLLLTIQDDPVTGPAQMAELRRRTVNPLHDKFGRQMAPYFQDYALLSGQPLHVTSASFSDSGTVLAHPRTAGTTTILVTTSASPSRAGRGYSFWVHVVERDGSFAVSDFGKT